MGYEPLQCMLRTQRHGRRVRAGLRGCAAFSASIKVLPVHAVSGARAWAVLTPIYETHLSDPSVCNCCLLFAQMLCSAAMSTSTADCPRSTVLAAPSFAQYLLRKACTEIDQAIIGGGHV